MADRGHSDTEALLAELEAQISAEYEQAIKDIEEKLADYLRRFRAKDEIWRKRVAAGEVSQADYIAWRKGQIMVGQRWESLKETLAHDLHNANVIARQMIDFYLPDIFAANANYAAYEIESGLGGDAGFTLYSRETVERLIRDNPDLLPPITPGGRMDTILAANKDLAWQKGQIQSVMLQSILQGESIPNMSKRIARTLGEINHRDTVRYARTAATAAQNGGRMDVYQRAAAMGIEFQKEWIATLDNRTRHEHRMLDGQLQEWDKPFIVPESKEEIMFPGDPSAAPHLVWNCRCTMGAAVKGWESMSKPGRSFKAVGNMSYEDWKKAKPKYQDILHQEKVAEAMKWKYINELYKGKG